MTETIDSLDSENSKINNKHVQHSLETKSQRTSNMTKVVRRIIIHWKEIGRIVGILVALAFSGYGIYLASTNRNYVNICSKRTGTNRDGSPAMSDMSDSVKAIGSWIAVEGFLTALLLPFDIMDITTDLEDVVPYLILISVPFVVTFGVCFGIAALADWQCVYIEHGLLSRLIVAFIPSLPWLLVFLGLVLSLIGMLLYGLLTLTKQMRCFLYHVEEETELVV